MSSITSSIYCEKQNPVSFAVSYTEISLTISTRSYGTTTYFLSLISSIYTKMGTPCFLGKQSLSRCSSAYQNGLKDYGGMRVKESWASKSVREQGWCSGESACLPPMWPAFSSCPWHHMWVEFVVGSLLAPRSFSPGSPVFSSPQKALLTNSNSIRNARTHVE